ncbi:DUF6262 family protein [Rhodococcus sp. H29-C3]|uniref:DUF6262 family protein n=1 Tax=Rhodococcus sp. H29-C3 TaxID=3046307 RepID=UPI0024B9DFE7|nr:DUF6262 family protein [Rhodococcus sp. H29-C3]MDJ0362227.1 DUF6262 family protein [Rhodococcus sp. H29-C3]
MSEHLIRAAKSRHDEALRCATAALQQMAEEGEPVTFAAVARRAGVSTDFLYNAADLRSKITDLRTAPLVQRTAEPTTDGESSSSSAIRALSSQLKAERRRHQEEVHALQAALATAHGENLHLRRRLAQLED